MAQKVELFRANVRRHVRLLKITFGELAEKANVSPQYLSKMLHGKAAPTLPLCERIAFALGTSLEALLAESASNIPPVVVQPEAVHKMAQSANSP